jgi:hypothetical protein
MTFESRRGRVCELLLHPPSSPGWRAWYITSEDDSDLDTLWNILDDDLSSSVQSFTPDANRPASWNWRATVSYNPRHKRAGETKQPGQGEFLMRNGDEKLVHWLTNQRNGRLMFSDDSINQKIIMIITIIEKKRIWIYG